MKTNQNLRRLGEKKGSKQVTLNLTGVRLSLLHLPCAAVLQRPQHAWKTLKQVQGDFIINNRAFTLIELLVVVLIIGILASVALPQYQKAVLKARLTQMLVHVNALHRGAELYYLENNAYPYDVTALDLDISGAAVRLGQSEKITTSPTVAAFFPDGMECMVNENAAACITSDWYIVRYHDHSHEANPRGLLCQPYTERARQVCSAMGSSVPVGEVSYYRIAD